MIEREYVRTSLALSESGAFSQDKLQMFYVLKLYLLKSEISFSSTKQHLKMQKGCRKAKFSRAPKQNAFRVRQSKMFTCVRLEIASTQRGQRSNLFRTRQDEQHTRAEMCLEHTAGRVKTDL